MDFAAAPTTERPPLPPLDIVIKPNPNFGPKGTGDLLVSARTDYDDTKTWTRTRWGVWQDTTAPSTSVAGSFEDAVTAARELVTADRRAMRWGLFHRLQGRVDAVAVLQAANGFQLVRVDSPVDPYMEPVPGAMTPWQKWQVDPERMLFERGDVRRERADVVALVGETKTFDLRATSPSGPTEPV
jgi:hypothetical protein